MKTVTIRRGLATLGLLGASLSGWAAPVAIDTTSTANGFTDLYSATFDGGLVPCTPSDPSWCTFFVGGKPPPPRNIVITPTPTGVINGVPLGITPTPAAGSYLELTRVGNQLTLAGGTIAVPAISLVIQGGTPNATVVNAGGAGVVFNAAPQVATLNASGQAEFLVNLAPTIAVDFSTFSVIVGAPNGSCSGPLCAIIPILTLDMVRYRLFIDYNDDFTTFTAEFVGQTGNNSFLSIRMNSVVPVVAAPEIAVTDSVSPAGDLQVPFGDVTELTSATPKTVTVTNTGTAGLILGTVAGLDPPFAITANTCSGATVAPGGTCTVSIGFTPDIVSPFSDILDIPSNDGDEPSVAVTVTGNGVAQLVPNINVTDSVTFASAVVGTAAPDQTVTVTNDGSADLLVDQITGPAAPFSIVSGSDGCSNQTVVAGGNCTITVRFEPTAPGPVSGTFDISSNDPPTVTVTLNGTGTSLATSEISVTDNTQPVDDLLIPFGNVTEGTTRERLITVTNTGSGVLTLFKVGGTDPVAAPFSIGTDECSDQTLDPGASCRVEVFYAPPGTGSASDSLDIPSDDADEPSVTVQLTGAGITLGEGGVEPPAASGADGGFMAVDPATLLLLAASGIWGLRRRGGM